MAFSKEFSALCAMFPSQIVSSSVIWCLKITHAFADISLSLFHFIETDLQNRQRGHKRTSFIFLWLYVTSPQCNEGEDPSFWNAKSEDLELEIAFIMYSHLLFCCFKIVVLWEFVSKLAINNSGHTKTENKRKVPFPGSWKIFSFNQEHLSTFCFHWLYFLTFPAQNQIIRQTRKSQTLPLSFISICVIGLECRLHCFVYYLMLYSTFPSGQSYRISLIISDFFWKIKY